MFKVTLMQKIDQRKILILNVTFHKHLKSKWVGSYSKAVSYNVSLKDGVTC